MTDMAQVRIEFDQRLVRTLGGAQPGHDPPAIGHRYLVGWKSFRRRSTHRAGVILRNRIGHARLEAGAAAAFDHLGVDFGRTGNIRIGDAEANVHGLPRDQIHLHELGGADTLVDLVGSFWLLEDLGIEQVYASPLPMTHGFAGAFPHPAPATARLLADAGAVLEPSGAGFEQVTPTGAAILGVTARFERPTFRARRVGYGAGGRDVPGNALRVWLGDLVEVSAAGTTDTVTVLETNLDDLAPIFLPALIEDLMAAGALDVSVATAQMKKGRTGQLITVLAPADRADDLARQLLRTTPTLGVRITEARRLLAERRVIEVDTELGRARVKLKLIDGVIVEANPEYDDCRRLARESGRDLREVMRLVAEAARP